MHVLQSKMKEFATYRSMRELNQKTGIPIEILERIQKGDRHGKYKKPTLDILYWFFALPTDAWYCSNVKKWTKPTESILGEIFRKKRIEMGLSILQVEARTHIGSRQIARIEAGDSLPSFGSYTMMNLINLYEFTEEEREKIRWFISILRDLVTMNNNLQ